jgi:hypothetical protein
MMPRYQLADPWGSTLTSSWTWRPPSRGNANQRGGSSASGATGSSCETARPKSSSGWTSSRRSGTSPSTLTPCALVCRGPASDFVSRYGAATARRQTSRLTTCKVAVAEQEQTGFLLIAAERLAQVASRWKAYELLYTEANTDPELLTHLHSAIVALYHRCLSALCSFVNSLSGGTAMRFLEALGPSSALSHALVEVETCEAKARYQIDFCESSRSVRSDDQMHKDMKALLDIVNSLQRPMLRLDSAVSSLLEKHSTAERIEMLAWISSLPYAKYHLEISNSRTPETCTWLLKHSRYLTWQDTSSPMIMWLQGSRQSLRLLLSRP